MSASWHLTPHATVFVDGVALALWSEWHTDCSLNELATADIVTPLPLSASVAEGKAVEIMAAAREDDAERLVFSGRVHRIDTATSARGRIAQLRCVGWAWLLTQSIDRDLVFAGGAPISPRLLSAQVLHLGRKSLSWYADATPDGTTVNLTFSPNVDAHFVHVTGRQHGANSYEEEPDRDLRDFSRVEIWQGGSRKGYTNLPQNSERFRDHPDFTNDSEWEDFDLIIGANIQDSAGDVIVKFVSGRKPGSSERDEYEVKAVTALTAARMTARELVSSTLRALGFGPLRNGVSYRVPEIIDLNGTPILLGGNGLVDNGHITLSAQAQAWSWLTELVALWGYAFVDGQATLDVALVRGDPVNLPPALVLAEGGNLFDIRRGRDVGDVVTVWQVDGASGSTEFGEPFQYQSRTDATLVATPAYLPGPVPGQISNDLLVSDGLAASVREVAEAEFSDIPIAFDLDTIPLPEIEPGAVVWVTAPTEQVDQKLWVTSVRHDFDDGGFWTKLAVRASTGSVAQELDAGKMPATPTLTSTQHIGVATIPWYQRDAPNGSTVILDWHPGGAFRAVYVTGHYHGANSFSSGSTPDVWSTVEIWQFGVRLGAVKLPSHYERYAQRRDYTNDAWWATFRVTIAADVLDASAEVRFVSGTAKDGSRDDYEVKDVTLVLFAEATEQGPGTHSGADWHAYQPTRVWRWAS